MKLKLLAITAFFTGAMGFAQYEDYNTWSVELNGGLSSFNKFLIGTGDIYPVGYSSGGTVDGIKVQNDGFNLNPLHLNLGVRKMFSPALGLRLGFNYDNIKNTAANQPNFDVTYMGVNTQLYFNINQITNAKLLWNRLNLLAHFGPGFSMFNVDDKYSVSEFSKNHTDKLFTITGGLTTQFRITDRFALTADISNTWFGNHQLMIDGSKTTSNKGYMDASVLNVSAGLTVYLGKNSKHIDWYEQPEYLTKEDIKEAKDYGQTIEELTNRIKALEARPIGANAADASALQGRIKDLENQIKNLNNSTKQMMDANIIHAYFDFDKDQPKASSDRDIQTAIDYMKNNPNATMDLVGHADNIGTAAYNENLSKRRVETIRDMMVKAGISASRLNVSWKGSKEAAQSKDNSLARKVVFRVK